MPMAAHGQSSALQIFVAVRRGTEPFPHVVDVRVRYEETIADVKRLAAAKLGIPEDKLQLFHHKKVQSEEPLSFGRPPCTCLLLTELDSSTHLHMLELGPDVFVAGAHHCLQQPHTLRDVHAHRLCAPGLGPGEAEHCRPAAGSFTEVTRMPHNASFPRRVMLSRLMQLAWFTLPAD